MSHEWMAPDECLGRLRALLEASEEAAEDGDPAWRAGLVEHPLVGGAKPIDQDGCISQALDAVALRRAIEAVEDSNCVVCSYCGHVSRKGDRDALIDHVLVCEKRPEKGLLDILEHIRGLLIRMMDDRHEWSDEDARELGRLLLIQPESDGGPRDAA